MMDYYKLTASEQKLNCKKCGHALKLHDPLRGCTAHVYTKRPCPCEKQLPETVGSNGGYLNRME